jgi:putative ABC transport system substrate-binding protein
MVHPERNGCAVRLVRGDDGESCHDHRAVAAAAGGAGDRVNGAHDRALGAGAGGGGRRRALLATAAALWVFPARARETLPMPPGGRRWRVGWLLFSGDRELAQRSVAAFVAGMHEKGWVQGEHYAIDTRDSGGDARRFTALAGELVALQPDVLIAIETTARAYREHTTTIPIVLWTSLDPVAAGLVASLAKPGTNVTGIAGQSYALLAKNIEALVEIVPRARRIALLYDPGWSDAQRMLEAAREYARAKGAELEPHPITTDARSVPATFQDLERRRPDGLVIPGQGAIIARASEILAQVRALRLPATGSIDAGGLVQQLWDPIANLREAADFVDRIFRGAKPGDLPVRQVMSYPVTVNARLAREIGVRLPQSLLIRADKVIE